MTSSNGNIFHVSGPLCLEFPGPGEFPTQRPVTQSFDVFFDLHLNKRLSKHPWGWWFEMPSWSLWRQCNAFYRQPEYWQICIRYISAWSTLSLHCDELSMDPMVLNRKYDIFPRISTVILPKVLARLYHVQPEMLAMIYWNLYAILICYIEKWVDLSELYKIMCCSVGWHTCKTIFFHSECLQINSFVTTELSQLIFQQ